MSSAHSVFLHRVFLDTKCVITQLFTWECSYTVGYLTHVLLHSVIYNTVCYSTVFLHCMLFATQHVVWHTVCSYIARYLTLSWTFLIYAHREKFSSFFLYHNHCLSLLAMCVSQRVQCACRIPSMAVAVLRQQTVLHQESSAMCDAHHQIPTGWENERGQEGFGTWNAHSFHWEGETWRKETT